MTNIIHPTGFTAPASPPYTVGEDAYQAVPHVLKPLGCHALLIGGRKALAAGRAFLMEALAGSGITLTVSEFTGECTFMQAEAFAARAKEAGACAILGMGGGKALDTAKAAAQLAGLPVMTLPTIAATCAAVTALSVMHLEPGSTDSPIFFLDGPPMHTFLHTGVLSRSPGKYLRAGIGDSLGKHVECAFKAGDRAGLPYTDLYALALAQLGYETLMEAGARALNDVALGEDSAAFRLAAQCCVVNTGLVSLQVDERFNGGLAHSLYYALRDLPAFSGLLHGDVVAWGSLVQLVMEGKMDEALRLRSFLLSIGVPASLKEMGIALSDIAPSLPAVLLQKDMVYTPYAVTLQMIQTALEDSEKLADNQGGTD